MRDPAIDWIRIDVVSPAGFEPAIYIGTDWSDRITERAGDVHVYVGAGDDHPGIIAAPRSDDVGDGRRCSGRAREEREDRRQYRDPRHKRTLRSRTAEIKPDLRRRREVARR